MIIVFAILAALCKIMQGFVPTFTFEAARSKYPTIDIKEGWRAMVITSKE